MPISKYYGGHGSKVLAAMKKRYGDKKGEQVFYATANKRGENPGQKRKKKPRYENLAANLKRRG